MGSFKKLGKGSWKTVLDTVILVISMFLLVSAIILAATV